MEKKKKTLKMTSQLVIFRFFLIFFNMSRTNSKTSKVNQQSVLKEVRVQRSGINTIKYHT